MFCVYWCNTHHDGSLQPSAKHFGAEEMSVALKFMEELRKTATEDKVYFITMSSENPNSVGKAGAADVSADYNWQKRRGNMPSSKYQKDFKQQ